MRMLLVAVLALLPARAFADVEVRELAPGAQSPAAAIGELAWLKGTWVGEGLGGYTEEAWSAPRGGAMVGYFRYLKSGAPVFYELLTIVEEGGSVLVRLKHFKPDLVGWEEKEKSVEFKLVALERQAAYFDGLTMMRQGGTLSAAVLIEHKDGSREVAQFKYKLAP